MSSSCAVRRSEEDLNDHIIIANCEDDIDYMLRKPKEEYENWGMNVNMQKTEYLRTGEEQEDPDLQLRHKKEQHAIPQLKLLKALETNNNLPKAAEVFSKSNATADEVDEATQKCIVKLYSTDETKPLNVLRYEIFAFYRSSCSTAFPGGVFAGASVERQLNGSTTIGLKDLNTRKNGMKCTTIFKLCKGPSCTNFQTEILILDPDDCHIDYENILEEGRRDFDDDSNNEEMEELEFILLGLLSVKRVKKDALQCMEFQGMPWNIMGYIGILWESLEPHAGGCMRCTGCSLAGSLTSPENGVAKLSVAKQPALMNLQNS
ncbi:hypothetical protein ILUMI_18783 [Ignelater luminosus]|uniref:Uncharacterized protein n=1 Tax=Ignelater luminosus TaxID=2038154 RepID=A0A8K0CHJ4_IGNLU|nr:hypothetical protein ILUMI_18783 [Ignelater luminosus]